VVDARRVAFANINTEVEDTQVEKETEEGVKEGELMTKSTLKPRKVNRKLVLRIRPLDKAEKS